MKPLKDSILEKLDINNMSLNDFPENLDDIIKLFIKDHGCNKFKAKREFYSEQFEMWCYKELKMLYLRGNPKKWEEYLKKLPKSEAGTIKSAGVKERYSNGDEIWQIDVDSLSDIVGKNNLYDFLNKIYSFVR